MPQKHRSGSQERCTVENPWIRPRKREWAIPDQRDARKRVHVLPVTGFLHCSDASAPERGCPGGKTVQVGRLTDVMEGIRATSGCRNVYLKLDTQGYDLEVINEASTTLASIAASSDRSIGSANLCPNAGLAHLTPDPQGASPFDATGIFPVSMDPQLRVAEVDSRRCEHCVSWRCWPLPGSTGTASASLTVQQLPGGHSRLPPLSLTAR